MEREGRVEREERKGEREYGKRIESSTWIFVKGPPSS